MTQSPSSAEAREGIKQRHLRPSSERTPTPGRGIHHTALISSDFERTIEFYQGLLGFPLTEIFENRGYPGSIHFLFDARNGKAVAFFDLPGLDLGPYAEVLGGLHHLALSVYPERWTELKDRLTEAGVAYQLESDSSIYFADPDGVRVELFSDPLGEMYGEKIG